MHHRATIIWTISGNAGSAGMLLLLPAVVIGPLTIGDWQQRELPEVEASPI
jgi:hypothetical protein